MSMTPDERMDTEQALTILRANLQRERESRREWQAWALAMERQLIRECWTQADFEKLDAKRPE